MPPPTDFTLDIPIFAKLYDFYKNLSFYVPRFPKTRRYTLGQELEKLTLEILKLLFSVPSSQNRFPRHECRSFFAQNKLIDKILKAIYTYKHATLAFSSFWFIRKSCRWLVRNCIYRTASFRFYIPIGTTIDIEINCWYIIFGYCKEIPRGGKSNMNFTQIANNITLLYFLALIVVLLTFIAYKLSSGKKSRSSKHD